MYTRIIVIAAITLTVILESRSEHQSKKSIVDDEKCTNVRSICNHLEEHDDILVLECLLSTNPERLNDINRECQNVIWNHTRELVKDENVQSFLSTACATELQTTNCRPDGKDNFLKCVLNTVKDVRNTACNKALLRLENVAFTDYKWIGSFLEHCTDDIKNLSCGLLDAQGFSQLRTVSCLQDKILQVKDDCKKEVFRLSEIQSNSIKLDAQLYLDCSDDHAHYCPNVIPGSGRVFPCLLREMFLDQSRLTVKCQQQLLRRQKLIVQDFRVSKGLLRACRDDIKKTHCRKQISMDKTVKLAQILLCLENVARNGTKLDPSCSEEMRDHRRMLMEDYSLSPEIVQGCREETQTHCHGYAHGGRTIHCLMSLALNRENEIESKLSATCLRALEDLIRETDVAGVDGWGVDPVLRAACGPVVAVACRGIARNGGGGGDSSAVLSCLMDAAAARSDAMTDECEDALLEIQYFVARDFKLDPQLFKACRQEASSYCHYFEVTEDDKGPSYGPYVLPCLYRQAYQETSHIQSACKQQIRRVMRQRAVSVNLHPEIEEACVKDLAAFCKESGVKRDMEIQCLQDNLDDLDEDCHKAVETYTEIEAQQVSLNPLITKYCGKIIDTLCNGNDEGSVMDCLIENKSGHEIKANPSCKAAIEHFQLISVKDYRFTYKFKVACKAYAMKLCGGAASKSDVVACLSEHILNSTVQGLKSSISKDCRQQLKQQIFQQREKIDYDPALRKSCQMDIKKFCGNVPVGNAQVLECLQTVPHGQLSNKCGKEVFKIQKLEMYDNSVDYALNTMCADTIDQFCLHHDKETVFSCLKANKDEKGFSKKCRMIVMHRLLEQNSNNLLNPSLQKNCQMDIAKFCKNELVTSNERKVQDSVVKCLKKEFKEAKLTNTCEKEVAEILRERALDVNLNPLIRVVCKDELETICKSEMGDDMDEDSSGRAEECLKEALLAHNIHTPECRVEVANMIEESQADIQADPVLQKACALDLLTHCGNIEQGNGRHIQCLRTIMEGGTKVLSSKCRQKLKERLNMYKNAAQELPPADFQQLYHQVSISPSKSYFAVVLLTILGMVFLTGVFCGRSRRYTMLKNK